MAKEHIVAVIEISAIVKQTANWSWQNKKTQHVLSFNFIFIFNGTVENNMHAHALVDSYEMCVSMDAFSCGTAHTARCECFSSLRVWLNYFFIQRSIKMVRCLID